LRRVDDGGRFGTDPVSVQISLVIGDQMRRVSSVRSLATTVGGAKVTGAWASVSLTLAMIVTLALAPATSANGSTGDNDVLVSSGPGSGEIITLSSLATCDVFDGLAIVKNTGTKSIRVVRVSAIIPTEVVPVKDQISFQLRSFPRGTTTGAAGAVANMPILGGHILGSAVGAVLRPVASSSLWYGVVIRVRVQQARHSEWVIRGLRVDYTVGQRTFTSTFTSQIRLPHTDC
jgi:hypothetical protein